MKNLRFALPQCRYRCIQQASKGKGKRKEPTTTNAIAIEVRNAAQLMAVDEFGNLRIGGDGLKNAESRKDADGLFESGAVGHDGTGIRADEDCASLLNRIWKSMKAPEMGAFSIVPAIPAPRVV